MRVVVVSALLIALSCGSNPRECIGGSVRCGAICADTNVDPQNCGACGQVCAMGEVCNAAACLAECSAGETQCQNGCTNLATDPASCGACGNACAFENATATCNAGACAPVCLGAFADCDKPGGCETDLATNPSSCGACAHDCLGGKCTDGKCDPIPVVTSDYFIYAMATTATDIVWNTGDEIRTVPKAGGTPVTLVPNTFVRAMAVDSANVYWAGFNIQKCAIAGCNGTPTTLAPVQGNAPHIATDGVNVYWTKDGVQSCAVGGCDGVPTTLFSATGLDLIETDGKNVYWTNWNGVLACPVFGNCQPTPISNVGGLALALDATNLYITGFKLQKCALAGCNLIPEVIWPEPSTAVAVDGKNIYWARDDNGTISRCTIDNCSGPTILATAQPSLGAIAVDGNWIYFTAGRSIWKVPK